MSGEACTDVASFDVDRELLAELAVTALLSAREDEGTLSEQSDVATEDFEADFEAGFPEPEGTKRPTTAAAATGPEEGPFANALDAFLTAPGTGIAFSLALVEALAFALTGVAPLTPGRTVVVPLFRRCGAGTVGALASVCVRVRYSAFFYRMFAVKGGGKKRESTASDVVATLEDRLRENETIQADMMQRADT